MLGDGTGHWTVRHGHNGAVLTELDPTTGTLGRAAEPPRIAATAAAGRLNADRARLLPMQPGLEASPLGTDGAALGSWVRVDGVRVTTGTADGSTFVLNGTGTFHRRFPAGRLTLPGGGHPLVVEDHGALTLALPDATPAAAPAGATVVGEDTVGLRVCRPGGLDAAGTALVPPLTHWHALRPRDEEGSHLLRALTDEQAARLIDAAWPVDTEPVAADEQRWLTVQGTRRLLANGKKARHRVPVAAVGEALPGIGHPLLRAGVAGHARAAVDLLDRIARFLPQPEAEARAEAGSAGRPAEHRPRHGTDAELHEAVTLLLPGVQGFGRSWDRSTNWRVLNNLRAVSAVVAAPPEATGDGWTAPLRIALHGEEEHHGWLHLLGRLGTAAYGAAAPLTSAEVRASIAVLFTELADSSFVDRGATVREILLTEPLFATAATTNTGSATDGRKHEARAGQVWRHGDRTVVILGCRHHEDDRAHWLAVDHDPSGAFGPVAHFGGSAERVVRESRSADWLRSFAGLLTERGALTHRAEAAADLGARTGIGTTRATLLLSPTTALVQWYGTPLPAEQLKEYGLKAAEARAARDWLRGRDRTGLAEAWAALVPADPAALWTDGPDTVAGARRWTEHFGQLVTLPEAAQATVSGASVERIEEVLNAPRTTWLHRTTRHALAPGKDDGALRLLPDDPAGLPDNSAISQTVEALRWLAYHLPHEGPLRPLLPPAVAALRARLTDPELLLDFGLSHTAKGKLLTPVLRAHFGLPAEGGADPDGLVRCGEALVLAPNSDGQEQAWLRPAGLTGAEDPLLPLLDGLAGNYWFSSEWPALATVLGDELDRLIALPAPAAGQTAGGQTAAGQTVTGQTAAGAADPEVSWPHHPVLSVPGVVADVAKAYGLGEDAAALYLQLLALPDPTDRNVARWTGWKPARLKKARAELAAADGLVLEAKRARAGRTLFLPGGWQEAKAPGLPVETWKAALYSLPTHRAVLPPLSVPELFARAWQRVTDGDVPGYEELRTGKRRKART